MLNIYVKTLKKWLNIRMLNIGITRFLYITILKGLKPFLFVLTLITQMCYTTLYKHSLKICIIKA